MVIGRRFIHRALVASLAMPAVVMAVGGMPSGAGLPVPTGVGHVGTATATVRVASGARPVIGSRACWSLIEPVSFTDVDGLDAESAAAIDCLAHYGITKGVTPTDYEPAAHVTRSQMARFLVRVIEALGLPLPVGDSQPFDDLDSVDASGRLAVARLHKAGIVAGRTPSRFAPDGVVARSQLVLLLHRLLKFADAQMPDRLPRVTFDDLGGVAASTVAAIGRLMAAGIMEGATPDGFGPRLPVTRADMALFLARTLDVAGARPVRLDVAVSLDSVMVGGALEATVTALKPDGEPYRGLLIDVFAAYRGYGVCTLVIGLILNGADAGTSQDCRIDSGDPRTDAAGTVRVGVAIHSPSSGLSRIYAWAGPLGRTFDSGVFHAYATFRWHLSPTGMTVSAPHAPAFEQDVTVDARLTGPNPHGKRMVLVVKSEDGLVRIWRVGESDGRGAASFALPSPADPRDRGANRNPITETVLVFWDRNGNSLHDGPAELSAETVLTWS